MMYNEIVKYVCVSGIIVVSSSSLRFVLYRRIKATKQ